MPMLNSLTYNSYVVCTTLFWLIAERKSATHLWPTVKTGFNVNQLLMEYCETCVITQQLTAPDHVTWNYCYFGVSCCANCLLILLMLLLLSWLYYIVINVLNLVIKMFKHSMVMATAMAMATTTVTRISISILFTVYKQINQLNSKTKKSIQSIFANQQKIIW